MTEQTERERLEALWETVAPTWKINKYLLGDRARRFTAMLDAGAYESAALMLVPRGWLVVIQRGFDDDGCFFSFVELTDIFTVGRGCDPEDEVSVTARKGALTTFHDPTALALCAAVEAALGKAP